MQEKMKDKSQGQKIYQKGDTEIRVRSNRGSTTNSDSGDFVDYEEVD